MRKISIVNNDFAVARFPHALAAGGSSRPFADRLRSFLGSGECFLTSCGFAAFSVILQNCKELHPERSEVVIPAYTAPAILFPIRSLGLTTVLCDVEQDGFLMSRDRLAALLGPKTLAVVAVHMFGLPIDVNGLLRAAGTDIAVIEDCAQSLGTEVDGRKTGTRAPFAFGSFSRGKNFSLYYGGFLVVNNGNGLEHIRSKISVLPVERRGAAIHSLLKFAAFSMLSQPQIYALTSNLLSRMKSKREKDSFDSRAMPDLIASVASPLFNLWQDNYTRRITNGKYLYDALKGLRGIVIPAYPGNAGIAFNRFPVIVRDTVIRGKLIDALARRGIEASVMYGKPIHHIWDTGYSRADLTESTYLAEHLLTLPVHGNVSMEDLDKIISVVYDIIRV
jgi:dTDP-4-amino-4,6-dideoxygalactose transaminase